MTNAQIVRLWDAINAVVTASGGNPGNTSVARQRAVVAVESVVTGIEDTIRHGARTACKRLRARVADLEDRLDFSDNGWNKALEERDAALLELRALEWLMNESAFENGQVWLRKGRVWTGDEVEDEVEHSTYASAAMALGWEG